MKRSQTAVAFAAALLAGASAKPLSMQPDHELRNSVLAAEVEILEVGAPPELDDRRGLAAGPVGRVLVRVSSDPGRVFRGFGQLGAEVELKLARGGPRGCALNLTRLVEHGIQPLMVVRPGNEIAFVGVRDERDSGVVYKLHHWCDYNAAWMFSVENRFGKRLPRNDVDLMGGFEAGDAEIRALFKDDYARFALQVADYLTAEARPVADEIDGWIAKLGDESFRVRQQAERQLADAGAEALGPLLGALREAGDREVAARIAVILREVGPDAAVARYGESLRRCATGDQVKVLNTALVACDEEHQGLRLRIDAQLKALADPKPGGSSR